MGMRLLPKNEVHKAKVLDRQREIEEGKKLATRVDSLRELEAQERSNLLKFRDETLKEIKTEIQTLTDQKTALETEIEAREQKRLKLLTPLDLKWEHLNRALKEFATKEQKMAQNMASLEENERIYAEQLNALKTEQEKLVGEKVATEEALQEALRKNERADNILQQANITEQQVKLNISQIETELIKREEELSVRERDTANGKLINERTHRELENERRALQDERETLERAFNELKLKQNV